jgi:PAS domain S-box-containing protein
MTALDPPLTERKLSSFRRRDWPTRRSTTAMTSKYVCALLLIALVSIIDYLLVDARRSANEAGVSYMLAMSRESILVERIAGLCQSLETEKETRAEVRAKLLAAISEAEAMRTEIDILSERNTRNALAKLLDLGVPVPAVDDTPVRNYIATARRFATARSQAERADALGIVRQAILGTGLADSLERFAKTYHAARMRDVDRLQRLMRWMLGTMLGVLLGTSLLVFRPMTRRIRREVAELEASEAYNRMVLQTASDGIITTDSAGNVESMNRSAARMFGQTEDDVLGKPVRVFLPWPSIEEFSDGGEESELRGTRQDGSTFPLRLALAVAELDGHAIQIGMVRDISERRRLEEENLRSERLATIGKMSAALAHEIRNPLGSIKLNVELLKELLFEIQSGAKTPLEEAGQLLGPVSSEVDRIQRVTDHYLQFARLPGAHRGCIDINAVLRDGLAFMKASFEQGHVELSLTLATEVPSIRGNAEQLWQAFLNVIRNSLEAMPTGGRLSISSAVSNDSIEVEITDSGVGMDADQKACLFRPFHTTKSTGTGLGLPLVEQIVREHGGKIRCESSPGKGTTFRFEYPAAASHASHFC